MLHIANRPRQTSLESIGIGSSKPMSTPGCLTGLKRFIARLLHREASRKRPSREEPLPSPSRPSRSRLPLHSASTLPRSPSPSAPPDITRREVMATRLEDLIQANAGPRLGLSGVPPSIYHRALGCLFTNNWDMAWGSRDRSKARCFPEGPALEARLEAMSTGAMPPLFVLPRPKARYWDSSLPKEDVKHLLSLDTDALAWPLQMISDTLEREGGMQGPDGNRISQHALLRALDAIRIVQSMLRDKPDLSLRELLARYPAHVADWRGARRCSDVPHEDWELGDIDDTSLPDKQVRMTSLLRELQVHAESATLPARADRPLAAIAIQGQRWLQASGPTARATQATRLMGLCQTELDRTAQSVDTLSPGDEARVRRRLRLLSTLMVNVRHREGSAFSLDPVAAPDLPAARNDSPIQKDRPGAGS